MPGERLVRVLALLSRGGEADPGPRRLCEVAAEATGMTGAGVMLMSGDIPRGSVCSSDDVSRLIEDLQFTLGEGPCVDAYEQSTPVLEPDLLRPTTARWPAFTGPASDAGAKAVFGFPMRVGAIRLGALNFYRDAAGPLGPEAHADALVMADVAARAVLAMQARALPDSLAVALEASAEFRLAVHQASGMVAVQLGVSVTEALIRLRAYAFANDRTLSEIADEIVARELHFDGKGDL
jgi:hypothetical protein